MQTYTRLDKDFHNIPLGERMILGFQQVSTNPDKVFVWMREQVKRPSYQDRHRTTREANDSQRQHEWGKSVWTKEFLLKHLGETLASRQVTTTDLENLTEEGKHDIWKTNGDGDRPFLKCIIYNPVSELTGEEIHIQITQQVGQAPSSLYNRAYSEANADPTIHYEALLDKYKNRAMVKTYAQSYSKIEGRIIPTRVLKEVFVEDKGIKMPIYEESEIVIGEPDNVFVKYQIPNELPVDILGESYSNKPNTRTIEESVKIMDALLQD